MANTKAIDLRVLTALRELCDSEQETYSDEILGRFVRELEPRVEAIRDAIRRGDSKALAFAAHSLKGSSNLIGARPMAELCRQLEQAGTSGAIAAAPSLLDVLEQEAERVREALATLKGETNTQDG